MGDERPRVRRAAACGPTCAGEAEPRASTTVGLDRLALEPRRELALSGSVSPSPHRGAVAQARERRLGGVLGLGDDAGEAAVPDHRDDARHPRARPRRRAPSAARAARPGWSTRPCSMPGRLRSWMKRGWPNTLSGMSRRAADEPAMRRAAAGFGAARQVASRSSETVVGELPVAGAQRCRAPRWCRPRRRGVLAATPSRSAAAARIDRARLGADVAQRRAGMLAPTGCPR